MNPRSTDCEADARTTTPSLFAPFRFARPVPSKPVRRWNYRKAKWSHYTTLTNKLAKISPPPNLPDTDETCQCNCKAISTATKKCISRGRRNKRIPCRDAECENLNQMQSEKTSIKCRVRKPLSSAECENRV